MIRFGKNEKLNPRYIELFEILYRIESLVYKLDLSLEMEIVLPVLYLSQLRKCLGQGNRIMD